MTTIYISGVFDMFHYGHMELIHQVRQMFPNCILIAGVHSDKDVASYKRTPIMTMRERIRTLKSSGLVDRVIGNAPLIETERFYQIYNINKTVHAHSAAQDKDYRTQFCPEAGDKLVRLNYTSTISTTELIGRILRHPTSSDDVVHQ